MFMNVNFYPDFILGDAVSKSGEDRLDEIQWRYGYATVTGASSSQSDELLDSLFDVSKLDFSKVADVVHEGIERSGITDYDTVYAFVRADSTTGKPAITVSIDGEYDDAYMDFTFDGELISASGGAFDE
jgi:hypothetical protein